MTSIFSPSLSSKARAVSSSFTANASTLSLRNFLSVFPSASLMMAAEGSSLLAPSSEARITLTVPAPPSKSIRKRYFFSALSSSFVSSTGCLSSVISSVSPVFSVPAFSALSPVSDAVVFPSSTGISSAVVLPDEASVPPLSDASSLASTTSMTDSSTAFSSGSTSAATSVVAAAGASDSTGSAARAALGTTEDKTVVAASATASILLLNLLIIRLLSKN